MKDEAQQPSRVRLVTVDREHMAQRVDNFLLRELKGIPRSRIYRLLRRGEVRVNGKRVKAEYRLQEGDQVRIPPVRMAERGDVVKPGHATLERIQAAIVFEDERLLVLDKPSGMAVHGGSGLQYGVIEALRALRPQAPFLELVHRLDRETSGLLMVAKRRSALRGLHELLRAGGVEKRYLALVAGDWKGGAQRVEAPLRKNTLRSGERIVRVARDGKPAVTLFRPLERYRGATLVEVELFTGRTHQIRVHGAHCGHPLAGDVKYGDESFNRRMRELGLKRLFLHAHRLAFTAPWAGEMQFSAPLPAPLKTLLTRLPEVAVFQ
jgi:23S rRNA pseudouridine955/2504/2580 synthase